MTTSGFTDDATAVMLDYVPELRTDFERHSFDSATVVWSPLAPDPVALDPVASVMLDVIDGEASVRELAVDVSEAVGVPLDTAERQVAQDHRDVRSCGPAHVVALDRRRGRGDLPPGGLHRQASHRAPRT